MKIIALEKRDSRSTAAARRIGYLSINYELANHSRKLSKKFCLEKVYNAYSKCKLAQLKMKRSLLRKSKKTSDVKNDILKFCTNIISIHRTSAFGGKTTP